MARPKRSVQDLLNANFPPGTEPYVGEAKENPNQCGACGRVYPQEVRHHSGVRECGLCWDWRKLGRSAADYWNTVINGLFYHEELGSGPDPIDYQQWDRWGIQAEVIEALNVLEAVRQRYELMLNTDTETRDRIAYPQHDAPAVPR
jgi:hypothetical protein